ncbi:MAG: hypothetical protein LBQ47_06010 [Endomicrobium sp.]|jgi:hypothetical protein|nr:hypothetical protein [Endomicrobium sp.]
MEPDKKMTLYKHMFLVSTVCGALGVYCLFKGFSKTLSFILIGIWGVVGLLVRIFIIKDKKALKDLKLKGE